MELDKRIKPNKMPLTCFDINKAKQFIGKNCYFSRVIESFENLNNCVRATLKHIDDNPSPFNGEYCFIMPCEWIDDPNDVETLKKTIEALRQKVAEQEKIIERLNGIGVRKECANLTEEPYKKEVDEFIKNLEKLLGE